MVATDAFEDRDENFEIRLAIEFNYLILNKLPK